VLPGGNVDRVRGPHISVSGHLAAGGGHRREPSTGVWAGVLVHVVATVTHLALTVRTGRVVFSAFRRNADHSHDAHADAPSPRATHGALDAEKRPRVPNSNALRRR
jgi:hypothetical protein